MLCRCPIRKTNNLADAADFSLVLISQQHCYCPSDVLASNCDFAPVLNFVVQTCYCYFFKQDSLKQCSVYRLSKNNLFLFAVVVVVTAVAVVVVGFCETEILITAIAKRQAHKND